MDGESYDEGHREDEFVVISPKISSNDEDQQRIGDYVRISPVRPRKVPIPKMIQIQLRSQDSLEDGANDNNTDDTVEHSRKSLTRRRREDVFLACDKTARSTSKSSSSLCPPSDVAL